MMHMAVSITMAVSHQNTNLVLFLDNLKKCFVWYHNNLYVFNLSLLLSLSFCLYLQFLHSAYDGNKIKQEMKSWDVNVYL